MIEIKNKNSYDGPGYYIGRPSILGNPYSIGPDGDRKDVIEKYEKYFNLEMKSNEKFRSEVNDLVQQYLKTGNLVLICWCKPMLCHGDIIAKKIEELAKEFEL